MTTDNEFEVCIGCGLNTGVPINTNVEARKSYIEGAGQLCSNCFVEVYKKVHKKDDNSKQNT